MSGEEVTLVAVVKVVQGKEERFEQLTKDYHSKIFEKEPETLQFQLHKEEDGGAGRYSLVERYKTRADLDKHRSDTLHLEIFQTFEKEGILAEAPVVFVGKAIMGHFDR